MLFDNKAFHQNSGHEIQGKKLRVEKKVERDRDKERRNKDEDVECVKKRQYVIKTKR